MKTPTLEISKIKIGKRHRKSLGNVDSLASSIEEVGLLHPVVVTPKLTLIAGERRIAACKKLGWDKIKATIVDLDKIMRGELAENVDRLDFAPSEIEDIRRAMMPEARAAAKERQAQAGPKAGKGKKPTGGGKFPQAVKGKTRDKVAAFAGVSGKTMEKIAAVVQAAEDEPEKFSHLIEQMDETGKVDGAYKKIQHARREEAIAKQNKGGKRTAKVIIGDGVKFLRDHAGKADLILTDPPYSTDVDDINEFAALWLPAALAALKPTGRLYACVGAYPIELKAYLSVSIPDQILVWTYRNTIGPTPKDRYKLNWQAILVYRGPKAGPLDCPRMNEQFTVQDIPAPDGRQGDRYHKWQKPLELGERFVRHATQTGDLVLDPFCGTGTFLLAASKLGRRALGAELNTKIAKIAEKRGCELSVKT